MVTVIAPFGYAAGIWEGRVSHRPVATVTAPFECAVGKQRKLPGCVSGDRVWVNGGVGTAV